LPATLGELRTLLEHPCSNLCSWWTSGMLSTLLWVDKLPGVVLLRVLL
jgi:hypothetical protein